MNANSLWQRQQLCESQRQQAADSRPLGARLDSAKATARKAASRLTAAAEALAAAQARHDEAAESVRVAEADLAEVRQLAQVTPAEWSPPAVAEAQDLLDALESSRLVDPFQGCVPEKVVESMRALRAALLSASPEAELEMQLDGGDTQAEDRHVEPSAVVRPASAPPRRNRSGSRTKSRTPPPRAADEGK